MTPKAFLPKSLFGRALLILVLPTVLIQAVMAYVFFESHWDNVARHISSTLAGEIAFFVHDLEDAPPQRHEEIIEDFRDLTGIDVYSEPLSSFDPELETHNFIEFQRRLRHRIREPFTLRTSASEEDIDVSIRMPHQALRLHMSVKRLESRTTTLFIIWMLGASAVFLFIAVIFLRNQMRPLKRLAEAADNFGRGIDTPDFRASGASEVRTAARAFIIMRERIKRQLRTRAEMLAGISHDLRTPLTRMKLQLAMLDNNDAIREMEGDVQQMEHMIEEYLDFARGEGREEALRVSLRDMLEDVMSDYQRLNAEVALAAPVDVVMDLRVSSFRRMLHNLIDNALRYGKRCALSLSTGVNYCEILIDDEGPGIPKEQREEVFKPFNRLEESRNIRTGGVGLGLTIARDIVLAHGGAITLDDAPRGGLRVAIRLPL